jgi:D-alanine transaminase
VIVHLNGELLPADRAAISPFDRGFLFGDGIYEGLRSVGVHGPAGPPRRRVVAPLRHARRMNAGLAAVGIGFDARALVPLTEALLDANGLTDAFIYWQVSRGTPPPGAPVRSRVPSPGTRPTVFGYAAPIPGLAANAAPASKTASVQPDLRWQRGSIKNVSLLGNVLATIAAAVEAPGAEEAILVRDGVVTEGTYTNVAVVGQDGVVATPALDSAPMLAGVTREVILHLDKSVVERPVRAGELTHAREVMLWGTTTMVTSVTAIDGRPVGDGRPGPHAQRLLNLLVGAIREGRDDLPAL